MVAPAFYRDAEIEIKIEARDGEEEVRAHFSKTRFSVCFGFFAEVA